MSTSESIPPSSSIALMDGAELDRRRSQLVLAAIGGGAISLMAALVIGTMFTPRPVGVGVGAAISIIAGAFIGLGHGPALAWALGRKRKRIALPLVYACSVTATTFVVVQLPIIWAFVTFTAVVPAFALLARLLPDQPIMRLDRCYACGYDVSAGHSGICPECGAPQLSPPRRAEADR